MKRATVLGSLPNAGLNAKWMTVSRKVLTIAGQVTGSLVHHSGSNGILRLQATSERDGVELNIAYNDGSPPATSYGTTTASAARGVLVASAVAILCTACSFAGIPPTDTPRASAPLPPGVTGPVLPPSYVPEPGAILALALVSERPARTAPPSVREAAGLTSAPDGTHGGA